MPSKKRNIRLRFAPSPTGFLHIGSLRTVLFDYLAAKSLGGKLILRVEDTDQKREVEGATENLVKILNWFGIKFDEGPGLIRAATLQDGGQANGARANVNKDVGDYGPYMQSQRLDIYKKYAAELLEKGGAYRCFCTPERLEKMRAEQQAAKLPPRYDRACRNLTDNKIKKKLKAGEPYVLRQKIPLQGEIAAIDLLRGEIKFKMEDLDDHVLIKSNGVPTYQFASVVDDYSMEITHVLRGDEWISSFPKNILLYESFGWQPPIFAHIPLIINKGGGKLSKRQGDVAVEEYYEKGYLPEALINFCALLGWHPKGENEIFSLSELEKEFRIEDIGMHPAIFDIEKLNYFNGWYIRHKSADELVKLCIPYLINSGFIEEAENQNDNIKFKNKLNGKIIDLNFIKSIVALEQERLKKLSEIGEATEFFFVDRLKYELELLIWKKMDMAKVKENLEIMCNLSEKIPSDEWTKHSTKDMIMGHIEATRGNTGEYLWPLRAALTGRKASPPPFEIAEILGKEESMRRIKAAMEKCSKK